MIFWVRIKAGKGGFKDIRAYCEIYAAEFRLWKLKMLSGIYENMPEFRFNPNHDPTNGRFTSGGSSSKDLTGGEVGGIIKSEEVSQLEQAKKRDHKINITDIAINSVGKVKLSDFTNAQINDMQNKHKELLKIAKDKNDSNEVLFIDDLNFKSEVQILGDEFSVSPASNPFAVSVITNAERQSLIYLHNHPSTNSFSVGDIDTFICEGSIKAMSVVTNQGKVYVLNKTLNYEYNKARNLMADVFNSFDGNEIDNTEFVKRFIKRCNEGGIEYAKSK